MTIYDIAQEAGVSASTVSRVINKKKGVNNNNRILVETLPRRSSASSCRTSAPPTMRREHISWSRN